MFIVTERNCAISIRNAQLQQVQKKNYAHTMIEISRECLLEKQFVYIRRIKQTSGVQAVTVTVTVRSERE